MRSALLAGLAVTLTAPVRAAAQEPSPSEAISATQSVSERLEREWACIRDRQRELVETVRLMREAQAQMARSASGTRAHDDARAAIVSLRQRAVRLEREALACRTEPSPAARSDAPPEGVVYRRAPLDPSERAVAQPNPATRVIERDVLLVGNVRAVVGEQVDGHGTVDSAVVRAAVRGVASRLSRCYDRMVDRGALQRGTIILAFTIQPDGRVTGVRTEQNSFRSGAFARCIRAAGRRIHPHEGASGGEAVISYTLQFPAD